MFSIGPAVFSCGVLLFPLSYIVGDILTEVYGYKNAKRVIIIGLIANVLLAVTLQISIALPPAPGWPFQSQFAAIHEIIPRIVAGSIVGYYFGEIANAMVLSRMKRASNGGKPAWRMLVSTIVGQAVDTSLFVGIAFIGVLPTTTVIAGILSGWIFKVLYEALALPVTCVVVARMKKLEGIDHIDT